MAITSQAGIFAFGPQSGKEESASTLYRHRASDIDLAIISDDRLGPPEVGGSPTPTIPYRAGVMAVGGATINPRLEDSFGWLLHGVAGDTAVATDKDVFDSTSTGFNHHTFTFDTTNEGFVPFMSFYKEIPSLTSTDYVNELYEDCKVIGLTLALPNDGLISARVDVIGRMATGTQITTNGQPSTLQTTFEDYESIPIGSVVNGYIKIPGYGAGEELPIAAATVTFANAPLDIRQEKVYGSPYLEDVTVVGRAMTVDMIVKWQDSELYRSIITGSTTATQWTSVPFVEDLDIYALTGLNAVSTYPWQLRIQAPKVMYQMQGGIRLAGNDAVMMRLTGTAIKGTEAYYTIHLGNARSTAYTWPT